MMKKILLIILSLGLFPVSIISQDLIIYKSDKVEEARIVEITSTEIVYKKFDNPDGPTYRIFKIDVSTILYENGTSETFENSAQESSQALNDTKESQIIEGEIKVDFGFFGNVKFEVDGTKVKAREVSEILKMKDEYIHSMFKKGKSMWTLSNFFDMPGFLLFWTGWGVYGATDKNPVGLVIVGTGAGLYLAGLIVGKKGAQLIKTSLSKYNAQYAELNIKKTPLSLQFGITQNGAGFTLHF